MKVASYFMPSSFEGAYTSFGTSDGHVFYNGVYEHCKTSIFKWIEMSRDVRLPVYTLRIKTI